MLPHEMVANRHANRHLADCGRRLDFRPGSGIETWLAIARPCKGALVAGGKALPWMLLPWRVRLCQGGFQLWSAAGWSLLDWAPPLHPAPAR